jgi:hypothetical protein
VGCPGYQTKPLVWSTKYEKSTAPSNTPLPASPTALTQHLLKAGTGQEANLDFNRASLPVGIQDKPSDSSLSSTKHIPSSPIITHVRRDSNPPDSLSAIRQQLHRSTVPEFLLHLPTMLVEYYFSYVCQIFSSFDGTLNPFRSTVGRLWDGSAPIYYAIQSMAAAYLANHFPRMAHVGVQMQRETYRCLYQVQQGGLPSSENLDKTLLTVFLVGQTTAWHNPGDLGLVHLKTAKRLNRRRLEQQASMEVVDRSARARRQNEFFEQCILYWDMLAGFVEDDIDEFGFGITVESAPTFSPDSEASSPNNEHIFPHPWTGVAPQAQRLFAQVGRHIRRYRKALAQDTASMNFLTLDLGFDIQYPQGSIVTIEAVSKAQSLEEGLLAFEPPSLAKLVDAGDENTPVQQYIYLAEAYRCAGLLLLYRIFPSVLLTRIPQTSTTPPLFDFLPATQSHSPDEFLLSLALHIISLLEKLPSNSGTRCLQPIVHIAAATELRFSSSSTIDPTSPFIPASSLFNSLTNREVDIATARRFVVTRLQEFQLSLPAKPIVKALELIQETWARADLGQDVYWMDVMEDMGSASIFG